MICRKCGYEGFVLTVPIPSDIDCPKCGTPIYKDHQYVKWTSMEIASAKETRCRVCGRLLTHPTSVARGIGPVCWANMNRKKYLKPLNVNDLCPRGWAWVIGDCNCAPDEGDCNDCAEPLAPIMKEAVD